MQVSTVPAADAARGFVAARSTALTTAGTRAAVAAMMLPPLALDLLTEPSRPRCGVSSAGESGGAMLVPALVSRADRPGAGRTGGRRVKLCDTADWKVCATGLPPAISRRSYGANNWSGMKLLKTFRKEVRRVLQPPPVRPPVPPHRPPASFNPGM